MVGKKGIVHISVQVGESELIKWMIDEIIEEAFVMLLLLPDEHLDYSKALRDMASDLMQMRIGL